MGPRLDLRKRAAVVVEDATTGFKEDGLAKAPVPR
jgi:hypothetical protein